MGIILWLIIGGVIGWIASMIMRTDAQQGIFLNIIVGIVGAFIGGLILSGGSINSAPLTLTSFIVSLLGAIVLLAIVSARTLAEDLAGYSDALEARLAAPDSGLAIRDIIPPGLLADVLRVAIDVVTQVGGTLLFALVVAALLLLDAPRLRRLVSGGLGSANPVFRQAPVIASAAGPSHGSITEARYWYIAWCAGGMSSE